MKSDHRHELKTNELADWIGHFPEWVNENRTTLIAVGVVVVVALGVYLVKFRPQGTVLARRQVRLTSLVTDLSRREESIATNLAQGSDQSLSLGATAEDLLDFADTAKNSQMAATVLIARGDALRAELHYRLTAATREEIASQIAKAQESYHLALERSPAIPTQVASAQFGLGLCDEELGNFDQARETYQALADDANFNGTVAQAAAAHRIGTMDDYKTSVVFKPVPPKPAAATQPSMQVQPGAAATPVMVQPGLNATPETAPNTPTPAPGTTGETPAAAVPEANAPAGN